MDKQRHTLQMIEERKELKKNKEMSENYHEKYREKCKMIKRMCKEDKKKYLEKKCEKIELCMRRNDSRSMFEEIKSMIQSFKPRLGVIKDETGMTLTESDDILERWKQYCESMFKKEETEEVDMDEGRERTEPEDELEPLRSEVEWAIKSLKDGKSPGTDNITAELIRASGEAGVDIYHTLCKKIWKSGTWPIDWKRAILIPIPKR